MAFDSERYAKLILPHLVPDRERARDNMRLVREISLAADEAITIYATHEVPSFDVSMALLEQCISTSAAIGWLSTKMTVDEEYGCWCLPLVAEFDEKNRARYPQVSNKAFGAHNTLVYRFAISVLFDPKLERALHWDHICRSHACCNPTHGELVSAQTNNARKDLVRKHIPGMETLI